jgi:hypothetical protein
VNDQKSVSPEKPQRVFISYAHSSLEHKRAVSELALALRTKGLAVGIDADVITPQGPLEGWPKWMKRQLKDADWVLLYFDEVYRRRLDGDEEPTKGLGATWEGAIITNKYYRDATINKKFIPLLGDGASVTVIPDEFFGYTRYHIPTSIPELIAAISRQHSPDSSIATLPAPVPTSPIEITLKGNLSEFNLEQQRKFLAAVSKLLEIADVTLKGISSGSIRIVLELPTAKAEELERAVQTGALSEFGVIKARILPVASPLGSLREPQARLEGIINSVTVAMSPAELVEKRRELFDLLESLPVGPEFDVLTEEIAKFSARLTDITVHQVVDSLESSTAKFTEAANLLKQIADKASSDASRITLEKRKLIDTELTGSISMLTELRLEAMQSGNSDEAVSKLGELVNHFVNRLKVITST